jgi:hypothetical protein
MKSIKVLTLIISAIALLPAVSFANILNPNTSSVSKPQLLAQVPARIRLKTQFTGDNKCLDIINDGLIIDLIWRIVETSLDKFGMLNLPKKKVFIA